MLYNLLTSNPSFHELEIMREHILASGKIAPDGCWIENYKVKNQTGTSEKTPYYTYYKLVSKSAIFPKKKGDGLSKTYHLGRGDKPEQNPELHEVLASISRREILNNLELRMKAIYLGSLSQNPGN